MRLLGGISVVYLLMVAVVLTASASGRDGDPRRDRGQDIFRYETFGDEQLWTNVLRMHEVIPNVDPATALSVGLKVDVDALPPAGLTQLRSRTIDRTR